VALARTERKTAAGYHGFAFRAAPEVRIEDDLARRDLTINSIAFPLIDPPTDGGKDVKNTLLARLEAARSVDWARHLAATRGAGLIDPFGGQRDLASRTLRHVTDAFAEDPVRILRLARFSARFTQFEVAPETQALMQRMVAAGEVDALVAERVWQELQRGLMEALPSRMLRQLRACGALARLAPEVNALWGVPQPAEHHPEIDTGEHLCMVLDVAASQAMPLEVRYALLCHDLGKGTTPPEAWPKHHRHGLRSADLAKVLGERWRVPHACGDLAQLVALEHGSIHSALTLDAAASVRLLQRCDAFRRPERFMQALDACACDAQGRLGRELSPYPQREHLRQALTAALSVDSKKIAAEQTKPPTDAENVFKNVGERIQNAIHQARVAAVRAQRAQQDQ
jgi:tRNA nucleotidyltransferase (CCA-adding enzyme)